MNKYEAAIAYFKERKSILAAKNFEDEAVEHINTAIEAMKKQVPRALKKFVPIYDEGKCPNCGQYYEPSDYCGSCGQKISLLTSECISKNCVDCYEHTDGSKVCEHYADKVDEIRRIHEES